MDRSYRIKLENWLKSKLLNQQLLINCVAKFDAKASKLAHDYSKYKNSPYDLGFGDREGMLQELIEYRHPFMSALCKDCHLTVEQIKCKIADTLQNDKLSKNIPDYKTIDAERGLLMSGDYTVGA